MPFHAASSKAIPKNQANAANILHPFDFDDSIVHKAIAKPPIKHEAPSSRANTTLAGLPLPTDHFIKLGWD